jgi:hypothetical protein
MSKQKAETKQTKAGDTNGNRGHLHRQYGNIGISAVAAAVRYVGDTKDTARDAARHEDDRGRARSVLAV